MLGHGMQQSPGRRMGDVPRRARDESHAAVGATIGDKKSGAHKHKNPQSSSFRELPPTDVSLRHEPL